MRIRAVKVAPAESAVDMTRVGMVFPAYNEEQHVAEAVEATLAVGIETIAVVNDCSTDGTAGIIDGLAAEHGAVETLHHEVNQGKQAAVKHGLQRLAERTDLNAVAVLDADMQNDPALLPGLCAHIGKYDLVIGARSHQGMPIIRRASNRLANFPYRLLAGVEIRDVQSGYRVYSQEVAAQLSEHLAEEGGYTLEHTSMLLFGRLANRWGRDFMIAEVPVPSWYEGAASSIGVWDNCQLTAATVYHALALADIRRRGHGG
jgi:glycosyltransferase involved in cell wall biosynthesis